MSKTKEVIEQVGVYTSASLLTQLIGAVGAIIVRYFLGPFQTGIWSLIQIILSYVDYSSLGVTSAVANELPYRRGLGRHNEADHLKDVVFSFSLVMSSLFAAGVLVYALVERHRLSEEIFYGLIITTGLIVLLQLNNVLISILRAYKEFAIAGKQMVISSVVNLILISVLAHFFKLYGFMAAMALSFVFNVIFIFTQWSVRFRWAIDAREIKKLIELGFPLMLLTLFTTLLFTIDKIMISRFLGLKNLGLYSIAVMAAGFIYGFPQSVSVVMIPNVSEKFGENREMRDLRGYLLKTNVVFGLVLPFLIALSWFAGPWVVHLFLSKFEGGIGALKTLSLSAYFIAVIQPYRNFIVVVKKQLFQVPLTLVSCALAFLANRLAIGQGYGIEGVGMATTLVMFFYFSVVYFFASQYVMDTRELWMEYLKIVWKFVLMLIVLFFVDRMVQFPQPFMAAFMKCLVFFALYAPFALKVEKEFQIFSTLWRKYVK